MNNNVYWDRYWRAHHERPTYSLYLDQKRNNVILKMIRNPTARTSSELKILEVGCGPAINLTYFKQLGFNCYGVDYSTEAIKLAKGKGSEIMYAEAKALPFESEVFDFVYSGGLIEHYKEKEYLLKEMARVCKKKGKVIATVPNLLNPWTVIKKFSFNKIIRTEDTYNPISLEAALNSVGLKKVKVYGICADPLRVVKPGLLKILDDNEQITRFFGLELIGSGTKCS